MSSTPRVLIVGGFAASLVIFRGELIQALLARGATVHAAAPDLLPTSPVARTLEGWGAIVHSFSLARTGQNPAQDLRSAVGLYRLCRRLAPSHVLAYTVKPVIYGMPAARLASAARTTALITGLGYAFTDEPGNSRQRYVQTLVQTLYRGSLRAADRVVFQNPDDLSLFLSLGLVDRARSGVIHGSGINLASFPLTPLPPLSPHFHFLLIARLIAHKGIYEFVEAARRVRARHPEARFHLVGMHYENPSAIRRQDLDHWIADGIITYHGHLADVRPIIAQCHVYVLPSYREGIPRTVLEAMAMGRPIITTNAPGCRETVEDGSNGYLVPVRDANTLTDAMLRLLEAPEQLARLGAASRKRAERLYDVDQVNRCLMNYMGLEPSELA